MSTMTFRDAIKCGLREEMQRDQRVFLIGEDVGVYGNANAVTKGLFDEFGAKRLIDTPISESAIIGSALGAALTGLVPVAEVMFIDFTGVCMDQIVNQVAKVRYMLGGQVEVPIVIRTQSATGAGFAAQHSQSLESWFCHIPGLKVVAPATPRDAKGLIKSAIRDPNPVVFIEHKLLYNEKGDVPDHEELIEIGKAEIKRPGKDITITAYSRQLLNVMEAARILHDNDGIDCEVIDLRTLSPLDDATIFESVKKTGHLAAVSECYESNGTGAEIIARITTKLFSALKQAPIRISFPNCPVPFNKKLEKSILPDTSKIVESIRNMFEQKQA